jgi:Domain of unknown function (DUF2715)
MKKLFLTTVLAFTTLFNAQENKFKNYSINIGFGGFSIKNEYSEGGGVTLLGNLTTSFNKNLFDFSIISGAEIGIFGKSNYRFNSINLLYGRELMLKKWFAFEPFVGIGFYNQTSEDSDILNGNTISLPIKLNTKFYFNKNSGVGINTNYIINKLNNNFSVNFIYHHKFN